MEHYDVANFFKMKWTMREKLIEKIYEPLSSVLEKHAKQLSEYSRPSAREVEDILSRTYYKLQMPDELLEELDIYIEQINDLNRRDHFARRAATNIVNKNVLECLGKEYQLSYNEAMLDLKLVSSRPPVTTPLHPDQIFKLLLKNWEVRTYISNLYLQHTYEKILIDYSNEAYSMNLDEFDERVWRRCLKEASENTEITTMKESADALWEEAWDLIDESQRIKFN